MSHGPMVLRLPLHRLSRPRLFGLITVACALIVAVGVGTPPPSAAAPTTFSLWSDRDVPDTPADPERRTVEVGTRFTSSQGGQVLAVRFYKSLQNTGTHTGSLWDTTGRRLATVMFSGETPQGWQQAQFANAVTITPGATYVVSYSSEGNYACDQNYFAAGATRTSGPLTATAGVYAYGSSYPDTQWQASNYYVDVVFTTTTTGGGTPTPTTTTTPTTSPPAPSTTSPTTPPTTPSSTPSTTSSPGGAVTCVGAANTPGGPDPWGGCWPGPHNTGYPHGLPGDTRRPVTLTAYTGPTTIRSCGVVIDSKTVDQTILIQAGNGTSSASTPCVTIRNSLVRGVIFSEKTTDGPILIEDTEIVPADLPWWENLGRSNFFAYRVNSHGGQGVIKCESNCAAKDNWVHGMALGGQYHYNAFGGNGTNNFRIEHNYASCGDWEAISGPGDDAGCSAVIGFYGDFGPIQNVTISRNYLASTFDVSTGGIDRQAGYCLNPGYYPGKPYPNTGNITVTDNVFARGGSGKCGVFGPTNSLNKAGQSSGNVWINNRYDDGATIPRPEE